MSSSVGQSGERIMSRASLLKIDLLVVVELLLQTVEVEIVSDVVFVHDAEKYVVFHVTEPLDPTPFTV
jgi:hypothetical protein